VILSRIELLGGLRVIHGEAVTDRFPTRKSAALLAFLASRLGQTWPRDALVDTFWPEASPGHGRRSLRQALTFLRRLLEPGCGNPPAAVPGIVTPHGALLLADRAHVRLNPAAVTVDVVEFVAALDDADRATDPTARARHLELAVSLYRGPLLPDLHDPWVLSDRLYLAERFVAALLALLVHLRDTGEVARATELAQRGLQLDPLREELHRERIRLLALAGRKSAALAQYTELERLLAAELGAASDPETRALVQAIRNGALQPLPPRTAGSGPAGSDLPTLPPAAEPATAAPYAALPQPLTRFFGRGAEIEQLVTLLSEPTIRLVTLTGTGGCGKTRLALQVARRLAETGPRAVAFVPLADLADGRLLPGAVRDALGLPRSPEADPREQIVVALVRQPTLLLLDNLEHLLADIAPLVANLLDRVPSLTCLTTSRQPLLLAGEQEFEVRPLPAPGEELGVSAAARLFVDRARAVQPEFAVTGRNAAEVRTLLERLEGLPLSIELAAARARVLTPGQMVERLGERFELLVSRQRGVAKRHRSLRAALEWSYELLEEEVQEFYARLSVFRGGWTVEAAEAVCAEPRALGYLEQLRECSLVEVAERDGAARFRMLETVREFSDERLAPQAKLEVQRRHAEYYAALARRADGEPLRGWLETRLDRLEGEHDNLRRALAWSQERLTRAELGLRLVEGAWNFWYHRNHLIEGRAWLEAAITHARNALSAGEIRRSSALAGALCGAGVMAYHLGDWPAARDRLEESVGLSHELESPGLTAERLFYQGMVTRGQRDLDSARRSLEQALTLFRQLDARWGICWSVLNLGTVALSQGDLGTARVRCEEALNLARGLDPKRVLAWALLNLGDVERAEEAYERGQELYSASLEVFHQFGEKRSMAFALEGLAAVALGRCQADRAACLFGAAEALRDAVGAPLNPIDRAEHQRQLGVVHATLPAEDLEDAWSRGRSMTPDQMLTFARGNWEATPSCPSARLYTESD
jgi:predicted ATPase/DNA-binding SARP family transcriptional activator